MKKVQVDMWYAEDGTQFLTEYECLKYEHRKHNEIQAEMFTNDKLKKDDGSPVDPRYALRVQNILVSYEDWKLERDLAAQVVADDDATPVRHAA